MQTVLKQFEIPRHATLNFKVEMSCQFNITAFIAAQKVNRFLLMEVGNMLGAGNPELVISEELLWRVPVLYALPSTGTLGTVGEIFVNAQTGAIVLEKSTPKEILEQNAKDIFKRHAVRPAKRQSSVASCISSKVNSTYAFQLV